MPAWLQIGAAPSRAQRKERRLEEIGWALSAGTGQGNTNVILRNVLKEDMFIIRKGFSEVLQALPPSPGHAVALIGEELNTALIGNVAPADPMHCG